MSEPRQNSGKTFRARFLNREGLLGTIIKTPTSHAIEIFGHLGFDFVMLDGEHAPFDLAALDLTLLATRAAGVAGIVRVSDTSQILAALDTGATGVMVPHVSTRAIAETVASACRYRGGSRGFAATTRAGHFGALGLAEHRALADATVTAIAMIEDPLAVENIDAIASVEGIDGFFIGRGDLSAAFDEPSRDSPKVTAAAKRIAAAAKKAGKVVCAMAYSAKDAEWLQSIGTTYFIVSSDHGFMRQAATQALADYAQVRAGN